MPAIRQGAGGNGVRFLYALLYAITDNHKWLSKRLETYR
jgi:hypothetical protein